MAHRLQSHQLEPCWSYHKVRTAIGLSNRNELGDFKVLNGQMTFNAFSVIGNISIKNISITVMGDRLYLRMRNICLLDKGCMIQYL